VLRGRRVRCRVPVRRVVAAADMPAGQTDAQVKPLAPGPETILAAFDRRRQLLQLDLVQMSAAGSDASDVTNAVVLRA
jgi:hypothetical protein